LIGMDEKKIKLILELRKDGRKRVTEISSKHKIPASTLFDIIHNLEKEGVVEHKSLVDFHKLGFPIHVIIIVNTGRDMIGPLKQHLAAQKNINTLFHLSHSYEVDEGYGCIIEGIFRKQKDVEEFMGRMEESIELLDKRIYHVIDAQKERFLTEEDHFR